MDSHVPEFKPEWLKSSKGSNGISKKHSNELGIEPLPQSKLSSIGEREKGLSSSKRSLSSNCGSKDSDNFRKSRAYSNVGRTNRYRDRDRNRDFDYFDRESRLNENGPHKRDFEKSLACSNENDNLHWSQPFSSGGMGDSTHKKMSISIASFEKEFPSLGVQKTSNVELNCPSLVNAGSSLQNTSESESWSTLYVGASRRIGKGEPEMIATKAQVSSNQSLALHSSSRGLMFPETALQAPCVIQTSPKITVDTHTGEHAAHKYMKMVPLTPSTKNSILSSSEKVMARGVRYDDPKVGLQPLPQPVLASRVGMRLETMKSSQGGNMQVLNRQTTNSILEKDKQSSVNPTTKSGSVLFHSSISATSAFRRPNLDSKSAASSQNPFAERRTPSHAKARHEFFNFIRSQFSNGSNVASELAYAAGSSVSIMVEKENDEGKKSHNFVSNEQSESLVDLQKSYHAKDANEVDEAESMSPYSEPDPEEEAFLRSLGWDANAAVDALTKEEIDAFNMKYKEWMKFSEPPRQEIIPLN